MLAAGANLDPLAAAVAQADFWDKVLLEAVEVMRRQQSPLLHT